MQSFDPGKDCLRIHASAAQCLFQAENDLVIETAPMIQGVLLQSLTKIEGNVFDCHGRHRLTSGVRFHNGIDMEFNRAGG